MALEAKDLGPDPWSAFGRWIGDAQRGAGQEHHDAMTLCTVGPDGWPQGRVVLLKGWDARGLRFFTSSLSEKGRALAVHPMAEAVFHWDALRRQVRVRGGVEVLGSQETRDYFLTRPRGSRLAAWASRQSSPVANRSAMEASFAEVEKRFQGLEVGPPSQWWGYLLKPERIEFWQEGAFRFHDRFVYLPQASGWRLERLFP